jgi:hypothetical protein
MGSEGCSVINDGHLRERKHVSFSGRKEWKADHADAEYIAGMHPFVALAVAGWLESLDGIEWSEHHSYSDELMYALKVARAYLGEAAR